MEQGEIGGTSNRHQTVGQALQDPDETKIELERRRKVQVLGTTMGDNGPMGTTDDVDLQS